MTAATTPRILAAIDCPHLTLERSRSRANTYYYFVYDDGTVFETRSIFVDNLSSMTLEQWTYEGRELVRRCKLMLGTSHVARMANLTPVRGYA